MNIFDKGSFRTVPVEFRTVGILSLNELTKFQDQFDMQDTDTTINSIRDAMVSNYLKFDLLNFNKHGFDAKRADKEEYLEVKQCSINSKRWGGTWNDTNEEKAMAFSDGRLFTVIAVWKGASDLQFMVYGQSEELGKHLLSRVQNRKTGSRSTQNVGISELIKKYGFVVIAPPDKTKEEIYKLLVDYDRKLIEYVTLEKIKTLQDL